MNEILTATSSAGEDDQGLARLLEGLHRARGFEFAGYKRSSLTRQVQRRMDVVGTSTYDDYAALLERSPDELPALFDAVLVNVTAFFRDPSTWQALARVPALLASRPPDRPLRVWSVGCASGEEAYTLAMVLGEVLGLEGFAERVKIYATDADEDALAEARLATYPAKAVAVVAPELLEKYFVREGEGYVFHKELRRSIIFGRHDLLQDAPISRVDVLACRNTLMYFNAEAQARILKRFHFALAEAGVLVLGKSEMLLSHPDLFEPLDLKHRLFVRTPRPSRNRRRPGAADAVRDAAPPSTAQGRFREAALDASPLALVALDLDGRLVVANQQASSLFGLSASDLGRPFQDLELSYRPAELRTHLDVARGELRPVHLREVERTSPAGDRSYLDVTVGPLFDDTSALTGTFVSFVDVTRQRLLQTQVRRTHVELEAAREELQSTSEELETTNEELQSTVEELETTNEELQSTNEELETTNQELQSANEELQTLNDELRQRSDELRAANAFFGSILASLTGGVTVLDAELVVRAWNATMEDLWGLSSSEVTGKHFLNLDLGLPLAPIAQAVRECLATGDESVHRLDAINRRGLSITCRVVVTPLLGNGTPGVIVLVEDVS